MKKCHICGKEATLGVKDTSDYYCQECAEENFGDVSYLQKIEKRVQTIKKLLDEKIENETKDEPEGNN